MDHHEHSSTDVADSSHAQISHRDYDLEDFYPHYGFNAMLNGDSIHTIAQSDYDKILSIIDSSHNTLRDTATQYVGNLQITTKVMLEELGLLGVTPMDIHKGRAFPMTFEQRQILGEVFPFYKSFLTSQSNNRLYIIIIDDDDMNDSSKEELGWRIKIPERKIPLFKGLKIDGDNSNFFVYVAPTDTISAFSINSGNKTLQVEEWKKWQVVSCYCSMMVIVILLCLACSYFWCDVFPCHDSSSQQQS